MNSIRERRQADPDTDAWIGSGLLILLIAGLSGPLWIIWGVGRLIRSLLLGY